MYNLNEIDINNEEGLFKFEGYEIIGNYEPQGGGGKPKQQQLPLSWAIQKVRVIRLCRGYASETIETWKALVY